MADINIHKEGSSIVDVDVAYLDILDNVSQDFIECKTDLKAHVSGCVGGGDKAKAAHTEIICKR